MTLVTLEFLVIWRSRGDMMQFPELIIDYHYRDDVLTHWVFN